jgi:hypothetical protein
MITPEALPPHGDSSSSRYPADTQPTTNRFSDRADYSRAAPLYSRIAAHAEIAPDPSPTHPRKRHKPESARALTHPAANYFTVRYGKSSDLPVPYRIIASARKSTRIQPNAGENRQKEKRKSKKKKRNNGPKNVTTMQI